MSNNYNNLPAELRQNGLFCLWKREEQKGRQTKIPYKTNGYRAKSTDKADFTDFNTAMRYVDKYNGIGLGIFEPYCAVDIDHCVENGELSELAQDIVNTCSSYTEYSPSGEGVRIIFKAQGFTYDKERYYINNRKLGLEIYVSGCTNKYVTLTGNVIKAMPIRECSTELSLVLDYYMKKREDAKCESKMQSSMSYLSDEEVITKALNAKNGGKFKRLWSGDFDSSHSEADLALCSHLAFWCGGDTSQMDRLFRSSGLYREKWERDDYRENTLKTAARGCSDFYLPIVKTTADEDFGKVHKLRELDPLDKNKYPWNDIGAGKIFADFYKDSLRYVPERKSWFYYKDGVWQADTGNLHAMKCCMELADLMYSIALEIKDEDKRKRYIKYATKWQSHSNRINILKDAQVYHPIPYGKFDSDIYIFNCKNGTLHLDTGEFTEHKPSDMLTKKSEVTYDPNAHSARFADYIDEIMNGDKEKAKFLQKMLGYAITGDTRFECMIILYGATTRNGKGTLCESVLKVLGDYGCSSRAETIAMKVSSNSSAPSEDVARLSGVRFVNIPEPSKGMVLDAAKVKAMTGNDTINARFLHENSFDFKPQFKIYVNANFLPVINDMTLFNSDRIVIIPFERHFDESSRDTTLKTQFSKSEAQSAILNWLIEGYKLLNAEGMSAPDCVKQAVTKYQHDSDKTTQFVEECLIKDEFSEVLTSNVYTRYQHWCRENGYHPDGMRNFKQALLSFAEVKRKRPKAGGEKSTLLLDYRLNSEFKQVYPSA